MSALYRRYRPQTFQQVIGQNHIKITLQNEIERQQIGHAYLFCGPRGLGKTTLARLMAKAINCQNRKQEESEPCNQCQSCLAINTNSSVDVIEIDAASHTGVDNVRENIIENSRFTPGVSKYKVFIIDEVHMLSVSAFNALLKTLEEPPAHAIFILCTTEIHKLPATIISRCQRFDLKKISSADMLKRLDYLVKQEKKQVETEVLKNIIAQSEGCVRDAESLLGKILTLGDQISLEQAELVLPKSDYSQILELLDYLLSGNTTAGVELINRLIDEGTDLQIFTDNLIELLRKLLLLKINPALDSLSIELDETTQARAVKLVERLDYTRILNYLDLFMQTSQDLKTAVIPQLPLEMTVVLISQNIKCRKEDDDFTPKGGGSGHSEGILKQQSKTDNQPVELAVKFSEVSQAKADESVKVDMLSKKSKLKPENLVDIKKIKAHWPEIVARLLEKNYTLSALLKISQPVRVKGQTLEIAVKSQFYQDRLTDYKNQEIVEKIISETVKAEVIIESVVKTDIGIPELEVKEDETIKLAKPAVTEQVIKVDKPTDAVQDVVSMF